MNKINHINLTGSNNISIQDVENSVITVNVDVPERYQELLDAIILNQKSRNTLNIVVLTATQSSLKNIYEAGILQPNFQSYSEELHEWRPFKGESTIMRMLLDFRKKSGFGLDVYFVEGLDDAAQDFLIDLEDKFSKMLLIVDIWALALEQSSQFAAIFDEKNLKGACILPISEHYTEKTAKYLDKVSKDTFKKLYPRFYTGFTESYMNIEFGVTSKKLLFRRLTNIAYQHFDLQPAPKVNILEQYKAQFKDTLLKPNLEI